MITDAHRKELHASAITPEVITARGYQTITNPRSLPDAFAAYQRKMHGLLIPIPDVTGEIATYQLKPDNPRTDSTTGKPIKYVTAANGRTCLDVPVSVVPMLRNLHIPLFITEGCKKVDSGLSNGIPCIIGVQGVESWSSQGTSLPDWKEIALRGRTVVLAFDSDVMTKESVRAALERFGNWLHRVQKAEVRYLVMPHLPDGAKCGLDDWFANGGARLALDDLITDTLPGSVIDWEEPIALDPTAGPPFPLEALPGTIGAYVEAVAEETQTAPDLAALVALGTISAAAGGKYVAYVPTSNYTEPVHVMLVPVAEPGNRKSRIFQTTTDPIRVWERDRQAREASLIAQWESRHRVLEKQLQAAESDQGKPPKDGKLSDGEARRMEALDALQAHLNERPVETEVFTDDATPEAVKEQLIAQGGAFAVMSAESAYLSNVAGRYSNAPHLDTILNGHAGDEIKVSRKGKRTERTERACLTLCLMLQPDVMHDLGEVQGFRRRGAAARLLPGFPDDRIGHRKVSTTPVPAELIEEWHEIVRSILDVKRSEEPRVLQLESDALQAFDAYRARLELVIKSEGRDMQGWLAKLAGTVLRVAGLLHIAEHEQPEHVPIATETIDSAISIGGYFHHHARIMYRMMYGRHGQSDAGTVLDVLRTIEGDTVNRSRLHEQVKGRAAFPTADSLKPALDTLEELGWIRQHTEQRSGPGRRSVTILLHPELHSINTINCAQGGSDSNISNISSAFRGKWNDETPPAVDPPLQPTGTDGEVKI